MVKFDDVFSSKAVSVKQVAAPASPLKKSSYLAALTAAPVAEQSARFDQAPLAILPPKGGHAPVGSPVVESSDELPGKSIKEPYPSYGTIGGKASTSSCRILIVRMHPSTKQNWAQYLPIFLRLHAY